MTCNEGASNFKWRILFGFEEHILALEFRIDI